jgi:hypothetical protein
LQTPEPVLSWGLKKNSDSVNQKEDCNMSPSVFTSLGCQTDTSKQGHGLLHNGHKQTNFGNAHKTPFVGSGHIFQFTVITYHS